jgi:hypothetical protein
MWFGDAFDAVLKLAASLGQLPGYHVAGAGCAPIRRVCSKGDSLTGSKFVFCHLTAFQVHVFPTHDKA